MRKKIYPIVIFVLLTLILSIPLVGTIKQAKYINQQMRLINDNYLLIFNNDYLTTLDNAYTNEEIDYVKFKEGIKNVQTTDYFSTILYSENTDNIIINELDIISLDTMLNYVYGNKIIKDNGIVISEEVAKKLAQKEKISQSNLIGTTLDFTFNSEQMEKNIPKEYIIEGIYDDSEAKQSGVNYIINDTTLSTEAYSRGLMKDSIDSYNFTICYEEECKYVVEEYDTDEVIATLNSEEITGYYDGDVVVDYEASIKNGIEGLVDPNTNVYPKNTANMMVVELDKGVDKETITQDIQTYLGETSQIVTNDSLYNEIYRIPYSLFIITTIVYIALVIALIRKYIKK